LDEKQRNCCVAQIESSAESRRLRQCFRQSGQHHQFHSDRTAQVTGSVRRVRAALEKAGTPIGPLDTMIAAHALALGLTIVADNEREFRRVTGLKARNWTK
jgi:predicted nucleic acid-binding protein